MGRSVWTHSNAIETVFRTIDNVLHTCLECETENNENLSECAGCGASMYDETGDSAQFEFDCLVEDIQELFKDKFPSMRNCDHWPESESHAITENELCMVVISEYDGLVSIGVVPTGEDSYYTSNTHGLAYAWIEKNAAPFLRKTFGGLRKIGTFSNGEAVFEKVQQ